MNAAEEQREGGIEMGLRVCVEKFDNNFALILAFAMFLALLFQIYSVSEAPILKKTKIYQLKATPRD
ncbi:MAG: hypothetical protein Q7S19_01000 [bacterium]|nr:hypothetical protein [bacterium]